MFIAVPLASSLVTNPIFSKAMSFRKQLTTLENFVGLEFISNVISNKIEKHEISTKIAQSNLKNSMPSTLSRY